MTESSHILDALYAFALLSVFSILLLGNVKYNMMIQNLRFWFSSTTNVLTYSNNFEFLVCVMCVLFQNM